MMHASGESEKHKVDEYLSDIVKPYMVRERLTCGSG